MIGRILDFRLKQLIRIFKEIGLVYLILLLVVCTGFFLGIIESLLRSTSEWMGLIGMMIVASIHFSRKDTNFLKKLEINRPFLYLWEYLLLTLPLTIIFIGGQNLGAVVVQTIGILAVAFLPNLGLSNYNFSNKMDFGIIPKELFEAKSYLRRFGIPMIVIYVLGLLAAQYITAVMTVVVLTALLFTSFFDEIEDKALFEAIHFRKGILTLKIRHYLGLYLAILLPYVILFLYWHLAYWYLILVALFLGSTLILFNIFYKYAHYSPHRRRVYNSMANSMFFFAIIIPFFYPVTLLYLIYYWRKARKNIDLYYAKN